MDEISGIELSLLEGMDEALLTRLHHLGIRNREDLEPRIATRLTRADLAEDLGVSPRRLEVLHHLNFLLPEERAERYLKLERHIRARDEHLRAEVRQLWRVLIVLVVGVVATLVLAITFLRPQLDALDSGSETAQRIQALEDRLGVLQPLALAHAEARVLDALSDLGPAPGWSGPLGWNADAHNDVRFLADTDQSLEPGQAVSLALLRLSELENAPLDSLDTLDRAHVAATLAADFPAIEDLASRWDAAAVLLRSRIRSRALGLAPIENHIPRIRAAATWRWTSPGFLTCEEYVARLESLPVSVDALPVWSETLVQIRRAADLGRDERGEADEALARDYWIRRGELELAVVAALLQRPNLLPYHKSQPLQFLAQRKMFLEKSVDRVSGRAKEPLIWLLVEYEEAMRLADWIVRHSPRSEPSEGERWVEALDAVENERGQAGLSPGPGVIEKASLAVSVSGGASDPWSDPRTRWEAGLRPLLMEARAAINGP
jgi:hypothetical protein